MTCDLATGPSIPPTHLPHLTKGSPAQCSSCRMITDRTVTTRNEATVRKAAEADLEVGSICADRDGNRIRIDRVDRAADTLSYHFLNDELRVQEGIQERQGYGARLAGRPGDGECDAGGVRDEDAAYVERVAVTASRQAYAARQRCAAVAQPSRSRAHDAYGPVRQRG